MTGTANRPRPGQPSGFVAFVVVWIGQLISLLATSMSQFALTIWAFQTTGSVTALGLTQVFYITPFLLLSPIAGVMIDRYNRKLMMMISDLGAGLATIFIFAMNATGHLEIWHLYVASFITGTFGTFQWPAYSASISLMVPKAQLGRANGLMSLMEAGPGVIAPLLAGALIGIVGLTGILVFDIVTFVLAVLALSAVFVPQPPRTAAGEAARGNILKEAAFGFKYIFDRPSLLGLQLVFFFGNLFIGLVWTLSAPMLLAHTDNNSLVYGSVQTAAAVGGIIGGIVMSAWGGFKRRSWGVLIGWIWSGITIALYGLARGVPLWVGAIFLNVLSVPLTNGSNQAIWQAKVAPDLQGRVFSARRLIAWFTNPITPLIAGPLADFVFEPAFRNPNSGLSQTFGGVVGVGPGSGMSFLIIIAGVLSGLVGVVGFLSRSIREADTLMPDHQALAVAPSTTAETTAETA